MRSRLVRLLLIFSLVAFFSGAGCAKKAEEEKEAKKDEEVKEVVTEEALPEKEVVEEARKIVVEEAGESVSRAPTARVTTYGGPSTQLAQAESYSGTQARIAVTRFTDKTGKGWYTGEIGDGMVDMLTTALFRTNKFIVLERQILQDVLAEQDLGASGRIQPGTEAPIGKIEGAELLVVGAVTEFEPHASGAGGGLGARLGGPVGTVAGGFKKAHIAIDLRIVDTKTSRILASTSVEGSATDVGGMVGILGGTVGGGLGGYKNTPTEKAIRVCLQEAVNWIVSQTPTQYYRHQ